MIRKKFPFPYHLPDKDSEKEEKPEQNHQKQRNNRDEQAAEICPRILIPCVRLGAIGTLSFACQKRALASGANFDCHAFRISKIAGKFNEFRFDYNSFRPFKGNKRFARLNKRLTSKNERLTL